MKKKINVKAWIEALPKKVFLIVGGVIAVLLIAVFVILNLPGNVVKRNVKSGDKLYMKGAYEKASVKYEKAHEKAPLDEKVYYNLICSYMNVDMEKAYEEFGDFDEHFDEITDKEECNNAIICDIYLLAPQIMTEEIGIDKGTLSAFLYDANFKLINKCEISDLLAPLYDISVAAGDEYLQNNDYDNMLSCYGRAVYTKLADEETALKMKNAVAKAVEHYIGNDDFTKATDIVNDYCDDFGVNKDELLAKISEAKSLYDTKVSLLKKVYSAMEYYYDIVGKDFSEESFKDATNVLSGLLSVGWVEMMEFDGSEEAEVLAKSQASNSYVYASDYTTGYTGLGCGLYTYGDVVTDDEGNVHVKYYFYFGNYKNGVRSGYGYSFAKSKEGSYRGFEGYFENDAPNGFGVEYTSNYISKNSNVEYQRVTYGNFDKGIENGEMTTLIRLTDAPEEIFKGTYVATNGIASEVPTVTENYELLTEVPEDQIVIAVIPSIEKGYDIYNVLYEKKDNKLSALGY